MPAPMRPVIRTALAAGALALALFLVPVALGQEGARGYAEAGRVAYGEGRWDEARALLAQAAELAQAEGDGELLAGIYTDLAHAELSRSDFKAAEELLEGALALYAEAGNTSGVAGVFHNFGLIAEAKGEAEEAVRLYWEAVDLFAQADDTGGAAVAYYNLGLAVEAQGEQARACEYLGRAEELFELSGAYDRFAETRLKRVRAGC